MSKKENEKIQETSEAAAVGTATAAASTGKSKTRKKDAGNLETPGQPAQDGDTATAEADSAGMAESAPVIFRISKNDGVVSETTIDEAITYLTEKTSNTEAVIRKMMADGKVSGDGETFFSAERKKLKKFEKSQSVEKTAESHAMSKAIADAEQRQAEWARQEQEKAQQDRPLDTPSPLDNPPSEPERREETEPPTDDPETLSEAAGSVGSDASETQYEIENASFGFEQGDRVFKEGTNQTGIVVLKDNNLFFSVEINNAPHTQKIDKKSAAKWRKMTDDEIEAEKAKSTALVKKGADSDAIDAEPVIPMTEEEKAELDELQKKIFAAKGAGMQAVEQIKRLEKAAVKAEIIIADNLAIIRDKKLFRESTYEEGGETHAVRSFKEYAVKIVGFADKYVANLAQIGSFRGVAKEVTGDNLNVSVNASNAMVRGTNKVMEALGLGDLEYNEVRPIIEAGFEVLGETVKDESGNIDYSLLKPRVITAIADKIVETVSTQTMEFEGEQIPLSEAREKGIAKDVFVHSVLETASEGIKTNKQYIKDQLNEQREETKKPPTITPVSDSSEVYRGALPSFGGGCRTHGKPIVAIGNGKFKTDCPDGGCWWVIDAGTGTVQPIEVGGKRVTR